MREQGLGLDACSPGDLRLAELAGFTASEITYTGFGSTDEELTLASRRASTLVVDSLHELSRVAELAITDRVGLRVNPAIEAGFHTHVMAGGRDSKFGIPLAEVEDMRLAADAVGLKVVGLHAHVGSDVLDASVHAELLRLFASLAPSCPDLAWLNLGGGWGTPRRTTDSEYDWSVLDACARAELGAGGLELRLEPGAHLTMDAGVILARVIAVKPSVGEQATVIVDANTNNVISALIYAAHHPVTKIGADVGPTRRYRIVGNLMQAGDVLVPDLQVSEMRSGDLIALGCVGAYASCRAGVFNERPRAAEILVRDGRACLIRRAETVDDLFSRDV